MVLNEKKRKWIIQQFRAGRSATQIARIQKVSRQEVYRLARRFKVEGSAAYLAKNAGRPALQVNPVFAKKVVSLRETSDYGSVKLHVVLKREGFSVSQRQIQKILDAHGLTEPCEKRRGQRKYVRFQWPIANYMWHCDWTEYEKQWYIAFIDDRSRKIMALGKYENATEEHAQFVLNQAMLTQNVCPVIILSDKGPQFYTNKKTKNGTRAVSQFEQELNSLGIELWTSRRNHPQTNGKMEKWFDTLKKRMKKHPDETIDQIKEWYNNERIHYSLEYKTPEETYQETL